MGNALISMFALGWIDMMNPVAVSMVLILLPMVRRRGHVLYYAVGSYTANVTGAIAIFLGVDRFLLAFLSTLKHQYASVYAIVFLALGLAAVIGCFLMTASFIRTIHQNKELSFEKVLFIKSASPWFILLLSYGTTWGGLFSAFAFLAFIGVLAVNHISLINAIWLIAIFSIFSTVPGLAVYELALHVKGERLQNIMNKVQLAMNRFCLFSIPVVLAALAVLFLLNAAKALTGL